MLRAEIVSATRRVLGFLLTGVLAAGSVHGQTYTEVTPGAAGVTSSTHDGNVPANTVDNDVTTRWSAQGDGHWIQYDLGSSQVLAYLTIGAYSGNTRRARFDIQVSDDATTWNTVWVGQSSGTTTAQETYEIADVLARHVRLLGHGNSANAWNSFIEVDIFASSGTPEPPTPTPPPTATPTPSPTPTPTQPPTPTPTPSPIPPGGPRSEHVNLGDDGRLVYHPYPNGDTIPDFSYAGYGGGGVRLPDVPVQKTVLPVDGDDGASIQAAIDEVSALPLDADGVRGTVLLKAGTYEVAGSLSIRASGVVLRGEGDGPGGTLIKAVGTARRGLIGVSGVGNRAEVAGTRQSITDPYVPVGARTFFVADGSGYDVGDDVLVVRTPNQEWIDLTGTDECATVGTAYDTSDVNNVTCISESFWKPSDRIMRYERKVVAVNGSQITVDAPMVEAFQAEFGGGYVAKYVFPGRIQKVGIESLRSESDFVSDTDEEHAVRMISLSNVENAWVRNATSVYYEQGTVLVGGGGKFITIQDSQSLDHKSVITGGRRYPFSLDDAAFVLVQRCYAKTGRHDYVTGSNTPGPNVFLDSLAEQSYSELGPHHRWATGSLFDRIIHRSHNGSQIMGAYNRGNSGSGHGWSGAYQLFWNCIGDTHRVASPPSARNWSIGCHVKRTQGDGEFESLGNAVKPGSLYLQQLKDRLGPQALINIGFSDVLPPPPPPTPTPTPSPTPTPTATPALIYEVEHLTYTTSGPTAGIQGDPLASNLLWQSFGAQVPGDWIEYKLVGVPRGVYTLRFKYKTNPNRGIHNVAVDGVIVGGLIDQYKTGAGTFPEPVMGTVRFDADGDHLVRLTSTGKRPAAGNHTISSDRFVLVPDLTAPVLTVPEEITAEATGPGGAVVEFSASALDSHDRPVAVTLSPASGSTFALGTTSVTATATDTMGNVGTKTFDVTVVDTTAPALSVPEDMVVEATGPAGAVVDFAATAVDLVSGTVAVTYDFPPGSTFALGRTIVAATASDAAENTVTAGFVIDVVDTTAPTLTLPTLIRVEATSAAGAAVSYVVTAEDLVSGSVAVTLSAESGSTFPLGTTTVSASAADAAGNVATGAFVVEVVDTTKPVLTLPAPMALEATSPAGAVATFSGTAQDVVSGDVPVVFTPASGSTFAIGTTTVTATATDAAGNTAAGTFTVTVGDTTAPVISGAAASPNRLWPPNHKLVTVAVAYETADAVGPVETKLTVTSDQPLGIFRPDWIVVDAHTVKLRAERSLLDAIFHRRGRTYTITIEAKDAAGNVSLSKVEVVVPAWNHQHQSWWCRHQDHEHDNDND